MLSVVEVFRKHEAAIDSVTMTESSNAGSYSAQGKVESLFIVLADDSYAAVEEGLGGLADGKPEFSSLELGLLSQT